MKGRLRSAAVTALLLMLLVTVFFMFVPTRKYVEDVEQPTAIPNEIEYYGAPFIYRESDKYVHVTTVYWFNQRVSSNVPVVHDEVYDNAGNKIYLDKFVGNALIYFTFFFLAAFGVLTYKNKKH